MPKLSSQRCRFRFVAGLHGRCALAEHNFKHFVLEGRCCPRWINVNGQVVHSKNPLYFFSRMSALAVSMQHLHFSFATHYEAPRFNADFQLVGRKTWHLGTEKDCFAGVFQVVAARMEKLGFSLQPIVHISTVYAATPFETS